MNANHSCDDRNATEAVIICMVKTTINIIVLTKNDYKL